MEGHKLHSVMQLGTASPQPEWSKETVCSASLCCDRDRQLQKMPARFFPLSWLCKKKEREEGRRAFIALHMTLHMQSTECGKGFCGNKGQTWELQYSCRRCGLMSESRAFITFEKFSHNGNLKKHCWISHFTQSFSC